MTSTSFESVTSTSFEGEISQDNTRISGEFGEQGLYSIAVPKTELATGATQMGGFTALWSRPAARGGGSERPVVQPGTPPPQAGMPLLQGQGGGPGVPRLRGASVLARARRQIFGGGKLYQACPCMPKLRTDLPEQCGGSRYRKSISPIAIDPYHAYEALTCGDDSVQCGGTRDQQRFYRVADAQNKVVEYNDLHETYVSKEHKPQDLLKNLYHYSDAKNIEIFGTAETPSVFSTECRERIQARAKELQAAQDRLVKQYERKKGAPSSFSLGTQYDFKKLIFDNTVPKGTYIKALTFLNHYTRRDVDAFDNRDDRIQAVVFGGQICALISPDKSLHHCSTGDVDSMAHADVYMLRGGRGEYSCIGCCSPHTGIARETKVTAKTKLRRTAILINHQNYDVRT